MIARRAVRGLIAVGGDRTGPQWLMTPGSSIAIAEGTHENPLRYGTDPRPLRGGSPSRVLHALSLADELCVCDRALLIGISESRGLAVASQRTEHQAR